APLALLAPDEIGAIADDSVELVINCDSLPEIGRETALHYLRQIRRISRRFLSINQETRKTHNGIAQNWVSELVEQAGGFQRVYRFRHWMEQGYVEELYERV
ncbi:MAG: hypothetical protein IID28_11335, partial [Planctomycetes bacterium]|nr:hypothetical protein [Planctomycetota bacterium]